MEEQISSNFEEQMREPAQSSVTEPDSSVPLISTNHTKKQSLLYKIWRVVYPLFLLLGIQSAASFVMIIYYVVTVMLPNMSQGTVTTDMSVQMMNWIIGQSLIITLISDLAILPVYAFLYIRQIKGQRRAAISSFKIADYVLVAALAVAADFAITYVLVSFDLVKYFPDYQTLMSGIMNSSLILQVVAIGIVAPIVEEFLMRGVILNRLLGYMRVIPALLIQAAMFGILHMNLLQGVYAGVLGLLMGYIYIKYGSLLMTILFHITLNTLSVVLPESFAEGVNPFYILIPALLVTAGILWLINRRGDSAMFFSNRKMEKVPQEE